MLHSIVIPHRNRSRALRLTIWSINNAAKLLPDGAAYEIIVSHAGHGESPTGANVIYTVDHDHPRVFNKPRLLNRGTNAASGDLLTFLDADMIVGPKWLQAAHDRMFQQSNPPTRLCHRVRQFVPDYHVPVGMTQEEYGLAHWEACRTNAEKAAELAATVAKCSSYAIAAEAYGLPEWTNRPAARQPVFGNSQWSILRDVLGNLRHDEAYAGAGFEDIDMIDTIYRTVPDYRGELLVDPEACLYHLCHERKQVEGDDWRDPAQNRRNEQRYYRRCHARRLAQRKTTA